MNESLSREGGLSVAVVDDEPAITKMLGGLLGKLGYHARSFSSGEECLAALRREPADIVITDLNMGGMSGFELLKIVKEEFAETEVIISTGYADKESALEALRLGAFDFFEKPVSQEELYAAVSRTEKYRLLLCERNRYRQHISFLREQESQGWQRHTLLGKSEALQQVMSDIKALRDSDRTSVLIIGESGTGKELVARAIHGESRRADRPFIAVNCSAIPEQLAESALFGHEKGSFTGATSARRGSFEIADGGTLFLDEIGDMLPVIQAKLLRVLEDWTVEPVGGTKGRRVDVRIIAATNADLERKVADRTFRQDLFHRLSAFVVRTPPLRERREDIPLLCEHFLRSLAAEMAKPCPRLSGDATALLGRYDYPGNIRELRNILEQAIIRCSEGVIEVSDLAFLTFTAIGPAPEDCPSPATDEADKFPLNLNALRLMAVERALAVAGGNKSKAARLLGVTRSGLYGMLKDGAMGGLSVADSCA